MMLLVRPKEYSLDLAVVTPSRKMRVNLVCAGLENLELFRKR